MLNGLNYRQFLMGCWVVWATLGLPLSSSGQKAAIDSVYRSLQVEHQSDSAKVRSRMYLVWLYQNLDARKAVEVADTLIAVAERSYNRGKINAYLMRGAYVSKGVVLERLGENDGALNVYLQVKSILPDTLSKEHVIIYNNIATIYEEQQEYSRSMELLLKALQIAESINFERGVASLSLNLAGIYNHTERFEQALALQRKAYRLAVKGEGQDLSVQLQALGSTASTFEHMGALDSALYYFQKVQRLAKEKEVAVYEGLAGLNIANIYYDQGDKEQTLSVLEEIKPILEVLQDPRSLVAMAVLEGRLALDGGILNTARQQAEKAKALLRDMPDSRHFVEVHELFYLVDSSEGNYRIALSHLREKHQHEQRASKQKYAQGLGQLQAEHQLRKQEEQIALQADALALKEEKLGVEYQRNIILSICIAVLLLFVGLLYISWRRSRQQRALLEKQHQIITQLNDSLEEVVRARTQKLHERNQELQNKNEKLEQYAFMNSHELRGPLASVLSLVYVLREELYDKNELEDLLNKLHTATKQLDEVIKEINENLR